MTTDKYITVNKDTVMAVIRAYQKSLTDINAHPDSAINTAIKYFSQLEKPVIEASVNRIIREKVIPESVLMTEESWNKAIAERVRVGDLKSTSPLADNVAIDLIKEALSK